MTATIIPFPIQRARPFMTLAQRRIALANVATDPKALAQDRADAVIELIATCQNAHQADLWREYGDHMLAAMNGVQRERESRYHPRPRIAVCRACRRSGRNGLLTCLS